jgi:hypothetical protein
VKVLLLIISYSVLTVWVSVFCQRRSVCQNRARGAICPLWFPARETDRPLLSGLLTPARSKVGRLGRGQRSRIAAKKKRFGITGHCPTDSSTRKEHSLGSQVYVWLTRVWNEIHYVCNNSSLSGGHRPHTQFPFPIAARHLGLTNMWSSSSKLWGHSKKWNHDVKCQLFPALSCHRM